MIMVFTIGLLLGVTLATFTATWILNHYMKKQEVQHYEDK